MSGHLLSTGLWQRAKTVKDSACEWIVLFTPFQPRDLVPSLMMLAFVFYKCLTKIGVRPTNHPTLYVIVAGLILIVCGTHLLPQSVRHWLARNPWLGYLEQDDTSTAEGDDSAALPMPTPISRPHQVQRSKIAPTPRSVGVVSPTAHFGSTLSGHVDYEVTRRSTLRYGIASDRPFMNAAPSEYEVKF